MVTGTREPRRPLLVLVPPGSQASREPWAVLVTEVHRLRLVGHDVRLRRCRGCTASEEAREAARQGVAVLVSAPDGVARAALCAELGAVGVPVVEGELAVLAPQSAPRVGTVLEGIDGGQPEPPPRAGSLHAHADAALKKVLVDLEAEIFAGNHIVLRHAALLENLLP